MFIANILAKIGEKGRQFLGMSLATFLRAILQ